MTKAAAIREAYQARPGLSTGQLGELFGCSSAYVRVVLRQRMGGNESAADRRWRTFNREYWLASMRAYNANARKLRQTAEQSE